MRSDYEYCRCGDCGSIFESDQVPTGRDPYHSGEILAYCSDCGTVDDFEALNLIKVYDEPNKAWIAYFANREGDQASGFKVGRTEEDAVRALKSAFLLPEE